MTIMITVYSHNQIFSQSLHLPETRGSDGKLQLYIQTEEACKMAMPPGNPSAATPRPPRSRSSSSSCDRGHHGDRGDLGDCGDVGDVGDCGDIGNCGDQVDAPQLKLLCPDRWMNGGWRRLEEEGGRREDERRALWRLWLGGIPVSVSPAQSSLSAEEGGQ